MNNKMYFEFLIKIFLWSMFILFNSYQASYSQCSALIKSSNTLLSRKITSNFCAIINLANQKHFDGTEWLGKIATRPAYQSLMNLINAKQNFTFKISNNFAKTLQIMDDGYEIDGISFQYESDKTKKVDYLIFSFNKKFLLKEFRYSFLHKEVFGGELINILKDSKEYDYLCRSLQRLETLYNAEEIGVISQWYDGALDILVKNHDKKSRRTASEYLKRLQGIADSCNIDVDFNRFHFYYKNTQPHEYYVALYQTWASSCYKDEGWLVLLLDLRNAERPKIKIREFDPDADLLTELDISDIYGN